MCNEPLRELVNAGASGSIFYVTLDDEFIVKTVQHKEGELLLKLLPAYFMVSRCGCGPSRIPRPVPLRSRPVMSWVRVLTAGDCAL